MTFPDQKLLNHLTTLIESHNQNESYKKEIIVIHNYKEFTSEEAVENCVKVDIQRGYKIIESKNMNSDGKSLKRIFIDPNNSKITHTIMAKKFSKAGEIYNEYSLNYVREKIRNYNRLKQVDLEKNFWDFLLKNTKSYYVDPFIEFASVENKQKNIKYIFPKKCAENIEKAEDLLKNNNENEKTENINLVKFNRPILNRPVFNTLGYASSFEKKQNNIKYKLSFTNENFFVELYLPGVSEDLIKENLSVDFKQTENSTSLIFRLKLNPPLISNNEEKIYFSNFEEHEEEIKVETVEICTEEHDLDTSYFENVYIKKGVAKFKFEKLNCFNKNEDDFEFN